MYVLGFCIYFCVYLSQTISRQPCIGIAWDLFWHATLAQEMQLEPVVVTISRMVPLIPAALPVPRPVRAQGSERTFPHQGKSILLLLAIHDWPAVWEPSEILGMFIGIIVVEIFIR